MQIRSSRCAALAAAVFGLAAALPAFATSTLVVSQFRARGPAGGNDEFIELHNAASAPVAIGGFKIRGSNNAGTVSDRATIPAGTTIGPGCYYLLTNTASGGYSGSVSGDFGYNTGITDDGGLALTRADNTIVDAVGLSTGSAFKEGTPLVSLGTTNADKGYERKPGGAQGNGTDTDDNSADFAQIAPTTPRNSSSTCVVAGNVAPVVSMADVTANEGDTGLTPFTFTVSLSADAPAGGVSFNYATVDGTALAGTDYVATSGAKTIAAGSRTQTITVNVIANTTPQPNRTFTVRLSGISGATPATLDATGTIRDDDGAVTTKIHQVQGSVVGTIPGSVNGCGSGNDSSPMCGQTVTVEAVVTATFPALSSGQLGGFNLQEEDVDADADENTSEGIFVYCPSCTGIKEGDRVRVTGAVMEYFGQTQISAFPADVVVTEGTVNHLSEVTPARITLPIPAGVDINAYYEAREGMLVQFDVLTVTEYFQLFRYGQIVLTAGDRPLTFTEDNAPSVAGLAAHLDEVARRKVILDDDRDGDEAPLNLPSGQQFVYWPRTNGGFSLGEQGKDYFRGGDKVERLVGVLQWSRPGSIGSPANTWRVRPSNSYPVTFTPVNLRPATPPAVGGSIRAVGMNLLNYFTTIDTSSNSNSGTCGPSHTMNCRGADSQAELDRQTARAALVICNLNPDVTGFMEMENNNVPSTTHTVTYLLDAVNQRCGGTHPYTFQNNAGGTLGTDAIRVMIAYRSGVLSPIGAALVDTDSIHNRPPMAQPFQVIDPANPAYGKRFSVVANHFKSKGSCPGSGVDADQKDGQSCWADTRRKQAVRTASWVRDVVIPAAGTDNVLLLGDFNSYAKETAVTALKDAGYHDLHTEFSGPGAYSYLFDGEIGHLDYAFANDALRSQIAGTDVWHINADEVDLFDYNDDIKDVGEPAYDQKPNGSQLNPPRILWDANLPIRASDHDPILVGLFPAVAQGQLTITPASVSFGNQAVGTTSAAQTVTLANTGTVSLDVTALTIPAAPFARAGGSCATTLPITLAAGTNCTLTYTFAPTAAGAASQTLTVTANAPGSGSIALAGTGTQGQLTITPTSVSFGNQAVGTTSSAQTVTLANTGNGSLNVTALTAPTAPFVRGGGNCPTTLPITLAAGGNCTLTYTFAPIAAGAASQTLTVTANAPGSGSIALSGTGTQGQLTITPTNVSFGNQAVGTTSAAQTVTLANTGSASLNVTALTTPATPFARTGGSCPTTLPIALAAGANCTLTYTFAPTAAGAASQTLTVTASAPGSGSIVLSGTGTAPQVADIAVTISGNRTHAQVGDTLTYVITVSNASGPATASVLVADALPEGLGNGSWTCVPSGAATCANGSGNVLGDTATLPSGTEASYVYSATVQAGAPDVLTNTATATVSGGVSDPNPANNSASNTTSIVVFRDGFESGDATLALAPYSDGKGFVSALLTIDRGLLDSVGIMPIAIASGRMDDGRTAFALELARFGADHCLRLMSTGADGRSVRGEWQAAELDQPLDFAWQSATAGLVDGYLRITAGTTSLQSTDRNDSGRLIQLHVPLAADATPWLTAKPE